MKYLVTLVMVMGLLLGISQGARAQELFEGNKPPAFAPGRLISHEQTIGGYQFYTGQESWSFLDASVSTSGGDANSIPMGMLRVALWDDGLVAFQTIVANIQGNNGHYWTGDPCAGEHLAIRKRVRGRNDDCMTIQAGSIPVNGSVETFLIVTTQQSQSNGRYYQGRVGFNARHLGFPESTLAQWEKSALGSDTSKVAMLEKLTRWGEKYQDAVLAQMDYRRPPDTFKDVPPVRALAHLRKSKPLSRGSSYVFCESTRTMVLEGQGTCPAIPATP